MYQYAYKILKWRVTLFFTGHISVENFDNGSFRGGTTEQVSAHHPVGRFSAPGDRCGAGATGTERNCTLTFGHRAGSSPGLRGRPVRVLPVRLRWYLFRKDTQRLQYLRVDAKCAIERVVLAVRTGHVLPVRLRRYTQAGLLLRLRSVHLLSGCSASGRRTDRRLGSQVCGQHTERLRHLPSHYHLLHSFHLSLRLQPDVPVRCGRVSRDLFDLLVRSSAEKIAGPRHAYAC